MNNSHELRKQLAAARAQLEAERAESENDELGDFFVAPLEAHAEELAKEVAFEEARESCEVVEFRLFGEAVNRGSIPLKTLAKLAGPLYDWIVTAAHHLRYGADQARGVAPDVANDLDIRLFNVGLGSTRLYLTGNTKGDLLGDQLFALTLSRLFSLLNADYEHFYEELHSTGIKSSRKLMELMEKLEEEELAVQFSWASPNHEDYQWNGRQDEIVRVKALLSGAETAIHERQTLKGTVALLSETGRIELHSHELGKKVKVHYSTYRYDLVKGLSLGDYTELDVECTRYFSHAADVIVEKYHLIDIPSLRLPGIDESSST